MNPSSQPIDLADYYFEFLKNLNPNSKLDLIAKLSQSLKNKDENKDNSLQSLFGAYQLEETAEEMIAGIRKARVSNRNIEPL